MDRLELLFVKKPPALEITAREFGGLEIFIYFIDSKISGRARLGGKLHTIREASMEKAI